MVIEMNVITENLSSKSKRIHVITAAILILVITITILHILYAQMPRVYENRYYSFSYPNRISIVEKESPDSTEAEFFIQEKIGGIHYYPLSNWDDFYTVGSSSASMRNTDTEEFLREQGILRDNETLDGYMLDIGVHDRSATLWERRVDVERDHSLFFTEAGHCYDVWFYCGMLSDSEKAAIIESFQLAVSTR